MPTQMQVASGDAWASQVARSLWMNDGDNQIDVPIALFFVSFFLIVGIVLLNVCPSPPKPYLNHT